VLSISDQPKAVASKYWTNNSTQSNIKSQHAEHSMTPQKDTWIKSLGQESIKKMSLLNKQKIKSNTWM